MSTNLLSSVAGMNPAVLWGTNPLTKTGMTSHALQGVVVDLSASSAESYRFLILSWFLLFLSALFLSFVELLDRPIPSPDLGVNQMFLLLKLLLDVPGNLEPSTSMDA